MYLCSPTLFPMKPFIRFAVILSVLFLGICCTEEPNVIEVTSVSISTKAVEMFIGETLQLEATVKPNDATDKTISWSSSDEAVVSVSSSGLVTALKEGNAIITALAGKCVSACTISVTTNIIEVTSLELNRTTATLASGETLQLIATVKPDNATDKTVEWTSNNAEVAEVDNTGKVNAIKEGMTTIRATAGNQTAKCEVTVVSNKVEVTSVVLNHTSISLKEGETIQLVATVTPDNATDKALEWTSRDAEVAEVDNTGKVTAKREGTTTIIVKAGNEISAYCSVYVISSNFTPNGEYLSFTGLTDDSSIWYEGSASDIQYSYDTIDWYKWSGEIKLKNGEKVYIKGCGGETAFYRFKLKMKGLVSAKGNIMSLLNADVDFSKSRGAPRSLFKGFFQNCTSLTTAPDLPATILPEGCYYSMFAGCTNLTTAPDLPASNLSKQCYERMFAGCTSLTKTPALPATTLAEGCYDSMFRGCTSLTNAPALPATTLAERCYVSMFYDCSGLTNAPALPATTLAGGCYDSMFRGCTSLTNAPALPATTLAERCYVSMFYDCSGLTNAPALPATTLAKECYYTMFWGCTKLTKAPVLPATTLAPYCYYWMFRFCSSLSYVKMMALNLLTVNTTNGFLKDVSPKGTFVKNAAATWNEADIIPSGWTVETATE